MAAEYNPEGGSTQRYGDQLPLNHQRRKTAGRTGELPAKFACKQSWHPFSPTNNDEFGLFHITANCFSPSTMNLVGKGNTY